MAVQVDGTVDEPSVSQHGLGADREAKVRLLRVGSSGERQSSQAMFEFEVWASRRGPSA